MESRNATTDTGVETDSRSGHTGRSTWRTLDDLGLQPSVQKQLERVMPADAADQDVATVESELAELKGGSAPGASATSRRRFLKLMGASMALAGMTACRWPRENVAPRSSRPEGRIPGRPVEYATIRDQGGVARGLLVQQFEGRPIKVEGNPAHPINGATYGDRQTGAASAADQASILEMYDPDRSQRPLRRREGATGMDPRSDFEMTGWFGFAEAMRERLGRDGSGVAILADASSSPTRRRLQTALQDEFGELTWVEYEPISRDNVRLGVQAAFGQQARPQWQLDQAQVIVSFDDDLFGEHPAAIKYSRDFANGRRVNVSNKGAALQGVSPFGEATEGRREMNRLYVVESAFTNTGATADHRFPVAPSHIGPALAQVARAVSQKLQAMGGFAANSAASRLASAADQFGTVNAIADERPLEPLAADMVEAIAGDLVRRGQRSAITVGPRHGADIQALAWFLNDALGSIGVTVRFIDEPDADRSVSHLDGVRSLVESIEAGEIQTLLILGGNPAFNTPGDVNLAGAIDSLRESGTGLVAHHSLYVDETSRRCDWHVPATHWLESWGDGIAWDGSISAAQPLIYPLFDGRSQVELLSILQGADVNMNDGSLGKSVTQQTWRQNMQFPASNGRAFERAWRRVLFDGVYRLAGPNDTPKQSTPFTGESVKVLNPVSLTRTTIENPIELAQRVGRGPVLSADSMEIALVPDSRIFDGRFANNGWLLETPEFVTTLCWDNALLVGLRTADRLGVNIDSYQNASKVLVRSDNLATPIEVPVYVLPGMPEFSAALWLGFGRTAAGRIAGDQQDDTTPVGTDGFQLATGASPFSLSGVRLERLGERAELSMTQNHWRIDKIGANGRQARIDMLVRNSSAEHYRAAPAFASEADHFNPEHQASLWSPPEDYKSPASAGSTDPQWGEQAHYKWGLAIDLTACTGCNACLVACQAENNVPVVGKSEIRKGREMHWIRMDRYFFGPDGAAGDDGDARTIDEDRVGVLHQPVMCVQCENAPCEQVCPVAATVHDHHGLNGMVYNRCIGTRYCSNNCPYKVRRFNYFYNHRNLTEIEKMRYNPNVTVRSRGVMEKCTYCVQRIETTKQYAKAEYTQGLRDTDRVQDGEIVPACAQTCPTHAIVFGDLNDESSAVRALHDRNTSYMLLGDLNTQPRTQYLAKISNPHQSLAPQEEEHGHGGH